MAKQVFHAVGKRKTAIARVYMQDGDEEVSINSKPREQYFADLYSAYLNIPFKILDKDSKYKISINVTGGGPSAQAEACMYGIAKALTLMNPEFRTPLKRAMLLTRDARIVERKKYGHKKARKSFQFSKR